MREVEVEDREGKKISLYGFPIRDEDGREKEDRDLSFDIKKLWSRQKEIIRLSSLGYKGAEISRMLHSSSLC